MRWRRHQNRLRRLVGSGEGDGTVGAEGIWPLVRGSHLETRTRSHWRAGMPIAADRRAREKNVKAPGHAIDQPSVVRSAANESAPL